MKYRLLLILLSATCLTSCDMASKINRSTCDIQRNTAAIERSTEAVNRNIVELEKVRQSR